MRTTDKPNILFIMADQHRYDYLEPAANAPAALQTPNLQRIAEQGTYFPNCTTNAPVCAPARIALATGLQPSRVGAVDNGCFLPTTVPTYYQQLRDNGYRVGCVGKLDLAKPDGYNGRYGDRPRAYSWGFTHPEECEGKMHAGSSPTPIGPYTHYLKEKGRLKAFHEDYRKRSAGGWIKDGSYDSVLPTEDFEDTYIGRRATEFILQIPADFPWHMFVSFVGPHDPFDPPTEYADKYRDADMPPHIADDMHGKPEWVKQRVVTMTPEEIAVTRQQYCAATELIDAQIGEMLAALEQRGMLENTYILYSSDHGEMLGDHGLYTKSVAYEASLRVPLLVAGPGIAAGQTSDALVELIDVNPTICELADAPVLGNIDARSIASVLRGETETHRTETVSALRNFRCIRTATHKLIENYNDATELYDLSTDPTELHNIARTERELVGELRARLGRRFRIEL